jgi:hypothetical protein
MMEDEFRDKLIQDLKKKNINVVNLRRGSFDLIIEGTRPFLCEIKQITIGGHRGFEENQKGFSFTPEQTREILKMKFPPLVIAYFKNKYYFLDPEWIKKEVTELEEYKRAIMYFSVRPFPPAKNYNEILYEIVKFTNI